MSSYEPDDGFDALLRDSMHGEAETVMPAGDGLSRIQQRVASRRARLRWREADDRVEDLLVAYSWSWGDVGGRPK